MSYFRVVLSFFGVVAELTTVEAANLVLDLVQELPFAFLAFTASTTTLSVDVHRDFLAGCSTVGLGGCRRRHSRRKFGNRLALADSGDSTGLTPLCVMLKGRGLEGDVSVRNGDGLIDFLDEDGVESVLLQETNQI